MSLQWPDWSAEEWARRLALVEKRYNPDEPRIPAGNPGTGGRWTSGGTGGSGLSSSEQATVTGVMTQDIAARRAFEHANPALIDKWADPGTTIAARSQELLGNFGDWSKESPDIVTALVARTNRWETEGKIPNDMGERIARAGARLHGDLMEAGASMEEAVEITHRVADMLGAAEAESVGRTLGDHGVRHLLTDAEMAEDILKVIPGYTLSAKGRAMLTIAATFHDSGYLTPPARNFMDHNHPAWSAIYAEQSGLTNLVQHALGGGEQLTRMIQSHADTGMDWMHVPLTSAFRLADNLALFHAEKLPALVRYVPKNRDVLERLGRDEITTAQAQAEAIVNIGRAPMNSRLKERLISAAREMSPILPKLTLGMLGGRYMGSRWRADGGVEVTLHRTSAQSSFMHRVADMGLRQFKKLAETYLGEGAADRVFKDKEWSFTDKKTKSKLWVEMLGTVVKLFVDSMEEM